MKHAENILAMKLGIRDVVPHVKQARAQSAKKPRSKGDPNDHENIQTMARYADPSERLQGAAQV